MDEELKVAWNLYGDSSDRCKEVEAEKRAKLEIQVMHSLAAALFS